jgi:hypothetical protein
MCHRTICVLDTLYALYTTDEVHDISTGLLRGSTKEFCPLNPKSFRSGSVKSNIYCIFKCNFIVRFSVVKILPVEARKQSPIWTLHFSHMYSSRICERRWYWCYQAQICCCKVNLHSRVEYLLFCISLNIDSILFRKYLKLKSRI